MSASVSLRCFSSLRSTGATNRRHIDGVLDRFSSTSRRRQEPYALVMFDIDHFKTVNDTEGYPGRGSGTPGAGAAADVDSSRR